MDVRVGDPLGKAEPTAAHSRGMPIGIRSKPRT